MNITIWESRFFCWKWKSVDQFWCSLLWHC